MAGSRLERIAAWRRRLLRNWILRVEQVLDCFWCRQRGAIDALEDRIEGFEGFMEDLSAAAQAALNRDGDRRGRH
jgi:hypothetical protein